MVSDSKFEQNKNMAILIQRMKKRAHEPVLVNIKNIWFGCWS